MAGLGSFARSQGVYQLEKAKADAINADTMIKWNKALRARQQALREDKQKEAARRGGPARSRGSSETLLTTGRRSTTCSTRSWTSTRPSSRSGRAKTPLSPGAIREIPFEWDSEAITLCIDQMTGQGSLPDASDGPEVRRRARRPPRGRRARPSRRTPGGASPRRRASGSTTPSRDFRAKFLKNTADFEPGYQDASITSPPWPA